MKDDLDSFLSEGRIADAEQLLESNPDFIMSLLESALGGDKQAMETLVILLQSTTLSNVPPEYLANLRGKVNERTDFLVLYALFSESHFDDSLITLFFDAFEQVEDQTAFDKLMDTLIDKAPLPVLKSCCKSHTNSAYFEENLLQRYNKGDTARKLRCLECLSGLLEETEFAQDFFYLNDLKTLLDICLQDLDSGSADIFPSVLEVVLKLVKEPRLKESQHRFTDLQEVLGYLGRSEDVRNVCALIQNEL